MVHAEFDFENSRPESSLYVKNGVECVKYVLYKYWLPQFRL